MLHQVVKNAGDLNDPVRTAQEIMEPVVNEIRQKLASLEQQLSAPRHPISATELRAVMKARARRFDFFPSDLFADPAWDMLLELYTEELGQRRITVSNLCQSAAVPATTALRWIGNLERTGLITRERDHLDGRRVWVRLSPEGAEAMRKYFESIAVNGAPL